MGWVAPRTWLTGDALNATNLNGIRDSLKAVGDPWASFVPTWGAIGTMPAIGNGIISGGWVSAGKMVDFWISVTMGTSTTYGTGGYYLTLPTTPNLSSVQTSPLDLRIRISTNYYQGCVYNASGANAFLAVNAGTAGGVLSTLGPTVPATFSTGSVIVLAGTYEAA